MQQLRLVSVQEDLGHQKVNTEALAAECSRRQEECNVAQAQLQAATAQNGQLESELSQSASAIADVKVSLQPPRHVDVVESGDFKLHGSATQQTRSDLATLLQAQHATLQAALQDKEGSVQALQTSLHEAQSKLEALEQSAKEAVQAAQHRHAAVEERARLSEQVLSFQ